MIVVDSLASTKRMLIAIATNSRDSLSVVVAELEMPEIYCSWSANMAMMLLFNVVMKRTVLLWKSMFHRHPLGCMVIMTFRATTQSIDLCES